MKTFVLTMTEDTVKAAQKALTFYGLFGGGELSRERAIALQTAGVINSALYRGIYRQKRWVDEPLAVCKIKEDA